MLLVIHMFTVMLEISIVKHFLLIGYLVVRIVLMLSVNLVVVVLAAYTSVDIF